MKQKKSKKRNKFCKKRAKKVKRVKKEKRQYRKRKYVNNVGDCICLNERFEGSSAHHLNKNLIIYIPIKLHQHLIHNIRDGYQMDEMNILALQYLYFGCDFLSKFEIGEIINDST